MIMEMLSEPGNYNYEAFLVTRPWTTSFIARDGSCVTGSLKSKVAVYLPPVFLRHTLQVTLAWAGWMDCAITALVFAIPGWTLFGGYSIQVNIMNWLNNGIYPQSNRQVRTGCNFNGFDCYVNIYWTLILDVFYMIMKRQFSYLGLKLSDPIICDLLVTHLINASVYIILCSLKPQFPGCTLPVFMQSFLNTNV